MTMSDGERSVLIKYRTEQAHEATDEVRFLIDNDKLKLAVNQVYYGMFYILNVLALKHKFQTSKHHQLIGWFNKNFIKDKKIDRKYSVILKDAFDNRSESDYGISVTFSKSDVEKMFEDMKDFISAIEEYMKGDTENENVPD